jgi:uncharacterized protein YkwD
MHGDRSFWRDPSFLRGYYPLLGSVLAVGLALASVLVAGTQLLGSSGRTTHILARRMAHGVPMTMPLDDRRITERASRDRRPHQPDNTTPPAANVPPASAPVAAAPMPTSRPVATPTRQAPVVSGGGSEGQVLAMVNSERAKAGCSALTTDSRLAGAARAHSSDMASRNYFSHDTPEGTSVGTRVTGAGYQWSNVGENIAYGQPDAQSVMQAWMNSSGHRANILNCAFRNIGIGTANSSRGLYWTQEFGTLR